MEEQVAKKRPTFITVLGILGFVGVGIQIFTSIGQMIAGAVTSTVADMGEGMAEGMAESMEAMEGMEGVTMNTEGLDQLGSAANELGNMMQHQSTLGLIGVLAAVVCLVGIIMMWKLKKTGFFVYVVGEIAPTIATLVLVGVGIGGFMAMLGMIFPVVFIILWALNLKHME